MQQVIEQVSTVPATSDAGMDRKLIISAAAAKPARAIDEKLCRAFMMIPDSTTTAQKKHRRTECTLESPTKIRSGEIRNKHHHCTNLCAFRTERNSQYTLTPARTTIDSCTYDFIGLENYATAICDHSGFYGLCWSFPGRHQGRHRRTSNRPSERGSRAGNRLAYQHDRRAKTRNDNRRSGTI